MKLLITGGLGFIGSNFIIHVLKNYDNYNIINVDAGLIGSNHKSLTEFENSNQYRFVEGNITDYELMKKLLDECDAIINFAAESHVDRSISNARPFIDSNIIGVFTILELLKTRKKRLIHISTDEVFGSLETKSADENFRFNPSSPYSSSKASAELLVNSYVITYGVDGVITRCTNNYGPRQSLEKLIPKTIALASNDIPIPIYNAGKGIRDWIFVDDHCKAIIKVLEHGKKGESYNISSSNHLDVLTIVEKILLIMNKDTKNYTLSENRPGHDFRYSLNSSKIRKELNWKPDIDFENGLRATVEWYLKNKDWWKNFDDVKELNRNQWKI